MGVRLAERLWGKGGGERACVRRRRARLQSERRAAVASATHPASAACASCTPCTMRLACRARSCCGALWWYGMRVRDMRTFRERRADLATATSGRRHGTRPELLRWAVLRISYRCTVNKKDAAVPRSIRYLAIWTKKCYELKKCP